MGWDVWIECPPSTGEGSGRGVVPLPIFLIFGSNGPFFIFLCLGNGGHRPVRLPSPLIKYATELNIYVIY